MNPLEPGSRILFIRASAVGDVLNTLPAVEAMRAAYPQATVGYLVDERSVDLIQGHPAIDRVHFLPRQRWRAALRNPLRWGSFLSEAGHLAKELRNQRYDVSVDLQRNLKGGLLGLMAGAKLRVGLAPPFTMEGNQHLTHLRVKPGPQAVHFAEHFLEVVRHLGAVGEAPAFRLPPSPGSVQRVGDFLAGKGLARYAVLHPGTSQYGRLKRWPPERFAELAALLGKEAGLPSVIAWGPGEGPLAERIAAGSGGQAVVSFETRSLLDLAELIRRAVLFVGCDSGPMHLSGAVGTPCVALFGPKDPQVFGAYRHPHYQVVQPPGGMGPTEGITVASVLEAALSLLGKSGPGPRK